ncbi:IQ and HECT domain protein [Talaromyces stipitatus ATCC 10500]|uniref:HECT-type E3 ubiquitin transferase n=1 Tax=Talaromyces stipitatus (strain ATCC 10500 / CBS 375.48 / QM 6759 / NRRL 1006) TaxID=441959 RepID=B8MGJ7_TALSN|nr:IQ and HECT domain protein [Talaromyces stipitatus ATCC 10500]EED16748.1 IQ and HECT domain protein [Talaromyces stipitatus ATCC 10500]
MFQSFTGSSRRPRQVNLSGRNVNPFASSPGSSRQPPHGHGPQNTLAIAQQERLARQLERERLNSARLLQRTWRGYLSRRVTRNAWRGEWDINEQNRNGVKTGFGDDDVDQIHRAVAYSSLDQCRVQLRLLLQFFEVPNDSDALRLLYFLNALRETFEEVSTMADEEGWTLLLARLAKITLRLTLKLASPTRHSHLPGDLLLRSLCFLIDLIPRQMARLAEEYYTVMAALTTDVHGLSKKLGFSVDQLVTTTLALLQPITADTSDAYEWFARKYLTVPDLGRYIGRLDAITFKINYRLLAKSLDSYPQGTIGKELSNDELESRIWLLAYFIFFRRSAVSGSSVEEAPEPEFVKVISNLLNSVTSYLSRRIEPDDSLDTDEPQQPPLHPFIEEQINSLVNQSSITGLLYKVRPTEMQNGPDEAGSFVSEDAKALASYALTLLRVFPRRGDDIRMWLYLGSTSSGPSTSQPALRIPAIKYFWKMSNATEVFAKISSDSNGVLPLLRPPSGDATSRVQRDQDWTIILLFLELYTFLLKVMDDEEFFSSDSVLTSMDTKASWTRESALLLKDVKSLTIFLKNLGFTLYWNAADLNETQDTESTGSIMKYFSPSNQKEPLPSVRELEQRNKEKGLPGVTGIPLDYFRGLVTGLLRMIHERDSRRKFLPEGHWLMTSRFDMEGFISAVVAEEENRHQLQDDEETEDNNYLDDMPSQSLGIIGTGRAQQARRIEAFRRHQQQAVRRKQLEALAPRLEILRHMPFFIPFATRVQIFREFIYRDQMRRRQGFIDPDSWRMSVSAASMGRLLDGNAAARDILSRHHASIHRDSVFDDAFEQFYDLGEGLKEPIQISFIDKFGATEAGIDGGGVTKEFLTSITNEAFMPSNGLDLFVENDQNLLYPNPVAVEQRKEVLRQMGCKEGSPEFVDGVRDLLKRYEFLGRVIGKCLYEGILVDVHFAGFFLLKWALTGGSTSARRESAYRANLNDLRDLDEGLYQGLLQLKNYPGDVEDFALNFTVTDTIPVPGSKPRIITKELKPGGANISVTNQNRLVYISYIARHRLQNQPAPQTNAFLKGLGDIIQPSWLSMFNQSELQTLVGGDAGEIDVADLRRNTLYGGVYTIGDDNQEHPTIQLFWQVMQELSNEDRQKVLKFVTSTPRAPLLGFSHLNPRFSIRDSSDDQDRLPSTSTCVNLLKLPRYSSAEVLRQKLLYAVNSGAGFDLS